MKARQCSRGRWLVSAHTLLESLENRRLLAGNVQATTLAGFLLLDGDELGNEVMLRSGSLPGVIIVHGMNQTRVNGSSQDVVFTGVERVLAQFHGGNDWFRSADLTLTSALFTSLIVDGGTGDDRIEMKNTTVHAANSVGIALFGEVTTADSPVTTGNDTIDLANTTIIAQTGISALAPVQIYGEDNFGGHITGGNDTITITDTIISATDGVFSGRAHLQIFGDFNRNDGFQPGGMTSTIGQGNDSISVTNTTITAVGGQFLNSFLEIFGDHNSLTNIGAVAGDDASTIGGGNDAIAVTNVFVATTGGSFQNFSALHITGDDNEAISSSLEPLSSPSASIGGGNDSISVDNVDVTATGSLMNNSAHLLIGGDANLDPLSLTVPSGRIGGGNDAISVTNSTFDVTGSGAGSASIVINGDIGSSSSLLVVQQGDDDVVLQHVHVDGTFSDVLIDTTGGDDTLDVQNSSFRELLADLGDGDDFAKFSANEFLMADLDGGPGHDALTAHNNIGALTFSNFEEENVTG